MIVLFKKLHSSENKQDIEQKHEETEEELELRLNKQMKSINRRNKLKKFMFIVMVTIITIGSFKSLLSVEKNITSAEAVNDYSFVSEYLQNYFKYPKEATETDYLQRYMLDASWQVEYSFDHVNSAKSQNTDIYYVKPNTDGTLSFYAKETVVMNTKDDKDTTESFDIKLTIAKKNNGYLVIKPVEMVYTQLSSMSDDDKKAYEIQHVISEGSDCDDTEKAELQNTIDLFFKTYASDYSQARLLLNDPTSLDPINDNTTITLENITSARKTESKYNVEAKVIVSTGEMIKQNKTYKFVIDKVTNKILEMEEY